MEKMKENFKACHQSLRIGESFFFFFFSLEFSHLLLDIYQLSHHSFYHKEGATTESKKLSMMHDQKIDQQKFQVNRMEGSQIHQKMTSTDPKIPLLLHHKCVVTKNFFFLLC